MRSLHLSSKSALLRRSTCLHVGIKADSLPFNRSDELHRPGTNIIGATKFTSADIEGGVENVDRLDDVSTRDHQAALKTLTISNMYGNCLGPLQLTWIVSSFKAAPRGKDTR